MNHNKEKLEKLIQLIVELSNDPQNEWFKKDLLAKILTKNDSTVTSPQIDDIYEYCLQKIIKEHAKQFYYDFKLTDIKSKLIDDFIRMESFRRKDNFEDFCLAVFQQIEGVVNELSTENIHKRFLMLMNTKTHKAKNKVTETYEDQLLWQLIFFPGLTNDELTKKASKKINDWEFMERYKLALYFYYFNQKIYNYQDFQTLYFLGNELYQSRNLNHRGGNPSPKQKITIEKVTQNSYKYFFKFLGFLEDFTTRVNGNL